MDLQDKIRNKMVDELNAEMEKQSRREYLGKVETDKKRDKEEEEKKKARKKREKEFEIYRLQHVCLLIFIVLCSQK